jgi:LmbE family N-acetylglucosaminyl deacetylase
VTLAYEGGHPDHDTCAFLTWWLSRKYALSAWEAPLYHRTADGTVQRQCFMVPEGDEALFDATTHEVDRKQRMLDEYVSQKETIALFNPAIERFRPQPAYDFSRPPHAGVLNYEAWGWSMSGTQLVQGFQCCLKTTHDLDMKDPGAAIKGFA